jgi:hypothetical protein
MKQASDAVTENAVDRSATGGSLSCRDKGIARMTAQPGALMRLVADGLAGNGYEVGLPEFDDGRRLSIATPAAQCALTVEDNGSVVGDWKPTAGSAADPLDLADLASALLTGRAEQARWEGDCGGRADLTLKGRVGRELRARGLRVGLEVYPDELAFEAHVAIVVTAPGTDLDGEVRVSDDGRLSWERDYAAEQAVICWEECTTWIADPGKVAADIVAVVTLALSQNLLSGAGQR